MSTSLPLVKLGEVLKQYQEYIQEPEPKIYPKLSVKLYGKGVILDEPTDGTNLKMKRHQIAKKGQVILSEIWGKKGAVGFVPPEGDGALCTSHFFLFDLILDRINPYYLQAIFTANYLEDQLGSEARGTTGYAATRPNQFLNTFIPLPPLDEQRRIVARIDALAARIAEARGLDAEITKGFDTLLRTLFSDTVSTPMNQLVTQRKIDVSVQQEDYYQFAGIYSFGKGMFKGQRKNGSEFAYTRLTRLHEGDFVYPKLMAWEGALAIVPPECNNLVVSPEFPVFEVNNDRVLPEVLAVHFTTPSVWPNLSGTSTGTNARRRRLHPTDFLNYHFPLPPMKVQKEIKTVMARVDAIRKIQAATAAELDALLPSVLDQAFRGEL